MAITIDNAFVEQFQNNTIHLAQQSEAKLRQYVVEKPLTGDALHFDRLGTTESSTKSGSRQSTDTIFKDSPWTRRTIIPATEEWADTVEHDDEVKMLINAANEYNKSGAMAMKRAYDDAVILAARADVIQDGVATALPAGNDIITDGGALQYSDILLVNDFFHSNDVDPEDRRCWVLSPAMVASLMADDKIINSDYQKLQMLQMNGVVSALFGGDVIMSNRLIDGDSLITGAKFGMCFTRGALCGGVNRAHMARIDERSDLKYLTQIYLAWTQGFGRIEDERIAFFDSI